mmetsp:Transcript_25724/g.48660  ORF Transcript_25724/g.48660 Transcript_25724/m.48660 type:complete len:226 (-) Transcript_25724:169-846(-)
MIHCWQTLHLKRVLRVIAVRVPHNLFRASDNHYGNRWTILGRKLRCSAILRQHHEHASMRVHAVFDGAAYDCLRHAHRSRCKVSNEGEALIIVHPLLCIASNFGHGGDGFFREGPVGCLPGQHGGVAAVKHRVGHIRHLCARGQRVLNHGLQHLRRAYAELPGDVALGHQHLLGKSHLLRRNLHAQVPASHHHSVGVLQYLVKIFKARLVLDLGDDLYMVTPSFV